VVGGDPDAARRMWEPTEDILTAARRGQAHKAVDPVAPEAAVRDCRGDVETNGAALAVWTDAAEIAEAHGRGLDRSESTDGGARFEILGVERV
jgi:hypothetical protein